jgi:hypothetical protein
MRIARSEAKNSQDATTGAPPVGEPMALMRVTTSGQDVSNGANFERGVELMSSLTKLSGPVSSAAERPFKTPDGRVLMG